jgi:hypothetical protein
VYISLLSHTCHMPHPSHPTSSSHPNDICWNSKNHAAPHHAIFSTLLVTSSLLGEQMSSSVPLSRTPPAYCLPLTWKTHLRSRTKQDAILQLCTFESLCFRQQTSCPSWKGKCVCCGSKYGSLVSIDTYKSLYHGSLGYQAFFTKWK